ncbi:MAG: hypothetical protein GX483_03210 [Actinomycetaceae bacterium]|nr:hypothetical protein [Actinomycetaceae bacterium]
MRKIFVTFGIFLLALSGCADGRPDDGEPSATDQPATSDEPTVSDTQEPAPVPNPVFHCTGTIEWNAGSLPPEHYYEWTVVITEASTLDFTMRALQGGDAVYEELGIVLTADQLDELDDLCEEIVELQEEVAQCPNDGEGTQPLSWNFPGIGEGTCDAYDIYEDVYEDTIELLGTYYTDALAAKDAA